MPQNGNSFIESLYLREYASLLKTAYRLTQDKILAENVVHETFVLAILHQKDLVSHPKPGAWLCQSLHNLIQNEQRAASRENIPLDEIVDVPAEKPPLSLTELLPSELTPEERDLLIWHFEQQMSYKEMAERLNISEAACRKRISRALASCKRLLDGG